MTDWKSDLRDLFNNTEKKAKNNEEKLKYLWEQFSIDEERRMESLRSVYI